MVNGATARQRITAALPTVGHHPVGSLAVIVGLGVALRLMFIGEMSVWVDEQVTLRLVDQYAAWELWWAVPAEQPHLPLYYVLLDLTVAVVGRDTLALRGLSVAMSLPAIPLSYLLGAHLWDARTGLFGGLVTATAPLLVETAMWIRMYALLATLGLAGTYATVRTLDGGGWRWRWATVAAWILLAWTHVYGLFAVAAQAALVVGAARGDWRATARQWAAPGGVAGLAAAPAVAMIAAKVVMPGSALGTARQVTHTPALSPGWVGITLARLAVGWVLPYDLPALVGIGVVLLVGGRHVDRDGARLLVAGAGPIALGLAASLVHPIFGPRYLLAGAGALAVLVARLALVTGRRLGVGPAIAGILAVALGLGITPPGLLPPGGGSAGALGLLAVPARGRVRAGIQRAYNRLVRPHLPRKIASYNGVPVRQPRLFDATDHDPDYESALLAAVRRQVDRGDHVVIVGGGWGVSAVVAAREAGPGGAVDVIEASREQWGHVRETCRLAGVADRVTVRHAVVGEAIDVWGPVADADHVPPESLPAADVLVLDCEGAERPILEEFDGVPARMVVETHELFDSSHDVVAEALERSGYDCERVTRMPGKDITMIEAVSRMTAEGRDGAAATQQQEIHE